MDLAAVAALRSEEGRRLLASLPPYEESSALAVGARLRRAGHDAALVSAALTQSRLRERAVAKLGPVAATLLLTADGLEQASRAEVAAAHADRFSRAGLRRVADLCCGVGADLLALGAAGLDVTGVEHDEVTAAVAAANVEALGLSARVAVVLGEAEELPLGGYDGVFVDPARRSGRGRLLDPAAWSPPWSFVRALPERVGSVGAKLAPGIAHGLLPATAEAEWVSVGGEVKECALWTGALSSGVRRRATRLPAGVTLTGDGVRRADAGPLGRWLYEPDGAVIRAGLVADVADHVGGALVDREIAYVTAERLVPTPFARAYEVEETLPFSVKRLRSRLADRGVGRLTVKRRGSPVDPDSLRRQLRLRGDAEATVVLTRVGGAPTALLVRPVPVSPAASPALPRG